MRDADLQLQNASLFLLHCLTLKYNLQLGLRPLSSSQAQRSSTSESRSSSSAASRLEYCGSSGALTAAAGKAAASTRALRCSVCDSSRKSPMRGLAALRAAGYMGGLDVSQRAAGHAAHHSCAPGRPPCAAAPAGECGPAGRPSRALGGEFAQGRHRVAHWCTAQYLTPGRCWSQAQEKTRTWSSTMCSSSSWGVCPSFWKAQIALATFWEVKSPRVRMQCCSLECRKASGGAWFSVAKAHRQSLTACSSCAQRTERAYLRQSILA